MTEVNNHTVNMDDMQGSFFVLFLGRHYLHESLLLFRDMIFRVFDWSILADSREAVVPVPPKENSKGSTVCDLIIFFWKAENIGDGKCWMVMEEIVYLLSLTLFSSYCYC